MSAEKRRPDDEIDAGPVLLRRHRLGDCGRIVAAVNESLAHLRPWMPWAQEPATEDSIGEFLAGAVGDFNEERSFGYMMLGHGPDPDRAPVLGGCGLHPRIGPGAIEIGYWVHVDYVRQGIAKASTVALRDQAYAMGVERVEIHCDQRNLASSAVARSAEFSFGGTRPRPARLSTESDHEMLWWVEAPIG